MIGNLSKMKPCGSYRNLVVVQVLESLIDELDAAVSEEAIKAIMNSFATKKLPLLDLLSTTNKAVQDIKKARALAKGGKATAAAAAGQHANLPTPAVFEDAPTLGTEIAILKEGDVDFTQVDTQVPFVMTALPDKHKEIMGKEDIKNYVAGFMDLFAKQEQVIIKEKEGRSGCKLSPTVATMVRDRIKAMIPTATLDDALKSAGKDALQPVFAPSLYGIVGSSEAIFGTEREFAPSLRMNSMGNRKVVMAPFYQLVDFMKNQKVQLADFKITQVRDYFKTMSKELLQRYVQFGGKLFHITIDAGSLLYTPPGYLFGDLCGKGSTNAGFRLGVVFPDEAGLKGLLEIKTWKASCKKDCAQLEALCSELAAHKEAPAEQPKA